MTRVILTNQYGEEVCELIANEYGEYELPKNEALSFMVGDTYKVEEVWAED